MLKTYHVMIQPGGAIDWGTEGPPAVPVSTRAELTLAPQLAPKSSMTLREAFEKLAELGTFDDIKDPVAWQREIRMDRPLPGREE